MLLKVRKGLACPIDDDNEAVVVTDENESVEDDFVRDEEVDDELPLDELVLDKLSDSRFA